MHERRLPTSLYRYPELMELVQAYFVARSCGQPPWALGRDLPRRRFYQTAEILSLWLELAHLWKQCPLLDSE